MQIPLRNNSVFVLNIQNDDIAKNNNRIPKIVENKCFKFLLDALCKSVNLLRIGGSSFLEYLPNPVILLYVWTAPLRLDRLG